MKPTKPASSFGATRTLRAFLASVCAVSMLLPAVTLASEPEPADAIDTSDLGDLGTLIEPRVKAALAPILQEAGLDFGRVRVRITYLSAENFEYGIRVSLDPSEDLREAPLVETCGGCMTDQLVEATVTAVEKAIAEAEAADVPDAAPVLEPEPVRNPEPVELPSRPSDRERKSQGLGPMGWAGIATLSAGVAALATGGAFLGIGETRPEDDKSQLRDFRPSGYALVGVGGAAFITGITLLAVDRVRAKRRGNTAWVPLVPGGRTAPAGIAVVGRF